MGGILGVDSMVQKKKKSAKMKGYFVLLALKKPPKNQKELFLDILGRE